MKLPWILRRLKPLITSHGGVGRKPRRSKCCERRSADGRGSACLPREWRL